jgi:hypothetical protein
MNAFRLLSAWRRIPGLDPVTGLVDQEVLEGWVREALRLLAEADRLAVGENHIGKMLAAAPPDGDGVRPPTVVRDLLESLQSDGIDEGLQVEIHNSRGATTRDPEAGGEMERELAKTFEDAAVAVRSRWPRTAAILRGLARSYEGEARTHDVSAERLRKGLER